MKNIPVYKDIHSDEKPVISKPLLEFNKFYKELNDLYHETALNAGLSESSFDILYSVFELGDGCLQSDIQKISFLPKRRHRFPCPRKQHTRPAPSESRCQADTGRYSQRRERWPLPECRRY